MQLEELERRIVFAQSLALSVELAIDAKPTTAAEVATIPSDIQFRDTKDDFEFASDRLDAEALDALMATSQRWSQTPTARGSFELDDAEYLEKRPGHYPPTVTADGVLVAQRFVRNTNAHTMIVARKENSECFHTGGSYLQQDFHYQISFDVRHPTSEQSWLEDHAWGIVMQMWGPRESGESPRNPPFAIYSSARDGEPSWVVRAYGDSRRLTQTGEFQEEYLAKVPMGEIGEWHHFDVEFVPNPFGDGLVRTWLNGQLIAEWKDVKNTYYSVFEDGPTGPLNPAFGLYSSMDEDGMEVHLDNLSVQCNGRFRSSLAGVVTGNTVPEQSMVYATNQQTGARYGTFLQSSGVYTLAVPPGIYAVTAINDRTDEESILNNVDARYTSRRVDLDVAPRQTATLTGDVTGDGRSEIVNRLENGSWQVSVAQDDGSYTTSTWGGWSTNVQWNEMRMADVNGDGRQDIVGRVDDGNWWVAESTGTRFLNRHWGRWSTAVAWTDISIGDFNGDGRSDIVGRETSLGTWWVSTSTGSRFNTTFWGRWSTAVSWVNTLVGDFNGDGRSDIAAQVDGHGSWWVASSTGKSFRSQHWGAWSNRVAWHDIVVGDFNGDAKSDIAGRTDDGNWWVAQSNGSRFLNSHWGRWGTAVSWFDVMVADVDGDGNSDIVGRASLGGTWWVAKSDGARFLNHFWGAMWSSREDWLTVSVKDFDGDGKSDLLGASSTTWLMSL